MTPKFDRSLIPPAPNFEFEAHLWEQGWTLVAGLDEAGRGALAGPVTAAALVFPPEPSLATRLEGVRDSKQMSSTDREDWAVRLKRLSLAWAIGWASALEIDTLGIVPATRLAMGRALQDLGVQPAHLLVDFLQLPEVTLPQTPLVKGDCRSLSIAAASILAKTGRDAHLRELDQEYPGYQLARHKGYGTPGHLRLLQDLGPSPIHRQSFKINREGAKGAKKDRK
jgi:ribonuclease HII